MCTGKLSREPAIDKHAIQGKVNSWHRNLDKLCTSYLLNVGSQCCHNFVCRKRYERAEKEFVEAKMDLHKKTEKKDLLTEHLYTIIRENELRKAKKLEELMAKLNVATNETLSEDKTAVLEAGSDESGIGQNLDISVPQEEKVNCELKPESNNSPVNTTGETAAIDESKVVVKAETMSVSAEQEVSVTA